MSNSIQNGVGSQIGGDVPNNSNPMKHKAHKPTELQLFDEVFPELVSELTDKGIPDNDVKDAMTWFKKVLEYNVPYGKKNRGLAVVQSYQFLVKHSITDEDLHIARVLGWCVEMLQAFGLVSDDIMDQSETRRGQPCWYKRKEVGLVAINDAIYLDAVVYFLITKYCKSKSYYVDILEVIHQTSLQTIIGQNLDTCTPPSEGVDFTNYTLSRYKAIVKWKTAYYSFYLPVALAMYMAGISDQEVHENAKVILLKMGEFFQIQDDYLDCYGDPAVTGKIGTDIEDNKCSWLIVQALERATDEQRQRLQENYAQWDSTKVQHVKSVFNELSLLQVYREYEEKSYKDLKSLIDTHCGDLPKDMFWAFAQKIYKRQK